MWIIINGNLQWVCRSDVTNTPLYSKRIAALYFFSDAVLILILLLCLAGRRERTFWWQQCHVSVFGRDLADSRGFGRQCRLLSCSNLSLPTPLLKGDYIPGRQLCDDLCWHQRSSS